MKNKPASWNSVTAITIENFKGIRDAVTIPLRPITLLFGANSAGKSTVLQALLYAQEVICNRNPDVGRTELGGETINLGGFQNLVHNRDLTRRIGISLHMYGMPECNNFLGHDSIFHGYSPMGREYTGEHASITEHLRDETGYKEDLWVKFEVAWDSRAEAPYIALYEVGFNDEPLARILGYSQNSVRHSLRINAGHDALNRPEPQEMYPLFEMAAAVRDELGSNVHFPRIPHDVLNTLLSLDEGERQVLKSAAWDLFIEKKEPAVDERFQELLNVPGIASLLTKEKWAAEDVADPALDTEYARLPIFANCAIPDLADTWRLMPRDISEDSFLTRYRYEFSLFLKSILLGPLQIVTDGLNAIRYLGPLRKVPDRSFLWPKSSNEFSWADGMAAWDALVRSTRIGGAESELVSRTNSYLADVLKIGYRVKIENLLQFDRWGEIYNTIVMLTGLYDDYDSNFFRRSVASPIENLPCHLRVSLVDTNSHLEVEPRDVGVGVSQVLPVVVAAADPDASIVAIEQPELHIHPRLQVELADVFLREVTEDAPYNLPRVFLLETHSEHMVLRIMRRMRETFERGGAEPADHEQFTVKPHHVCVLYVENYDNRTIVREMPLNEAGELVKSWPGGFFEEALRETL